VRAPSSSPRAFASALALLDKFATRLAALTAPHAPIAWEALKQDH
jgi:hypothetical protein